MKIETAPRKLHLILILIGTSILAIPAALGTYALLDMSSNSQWDADKSLSKALVAISILGFALFSGYILTAIFNRYNPALWLSSMIYNAALSLCYLGFIGSSVAAESFSFQAVYGFLTSGAWLLPVWTIYVTVASGYYLKHSFRPNKNILP
jgi:FtsH-binding integral membrane protein